MNLDTPHLKRLVWVLVLVTMLLAGFIGLRSMSSLYAYFERARVLDQALNVTEPSQPQADRLMWLADDLLPRPLEPIVREGIAKDYLLSFEELSYSLLSQDSSGLSSYFQAGALDDALLASSSMPSQFVAWNHRLHLRFYSPDGSTIAFSDTYHYTQAALKGQDLETIRIAERDLDVIMQLDNGTWRIHHWRITRDSVQENVSPTQFASLQTTISTMRGINYTPRSAPFDAFWPNFNAVELEADFAASQALGLDTVRFFIPYPLPEGVKENLPVLLQTAKRYDLKLMPTLLDTYTTYRLEDLPQILAYLDELKSFLRDESVVLIDLKNEADRDFVASGPERVKTFLSYVLSSLRNEIAKPLTIGLINPDPDLSKDLDVISLHHYASSESLAARLAEAKTYGKPVLLQEFGFHTLALKLPDPHSMQEQARYYFEVLTQTKAQDVGWLAWTLYDLPSGKMPGGRQVERHLGILKANGQSKPVVNVLLNSLQSGDLQQDVASPPKASFVEYFIKYRYFLLIWGFVLLLLMSIYKYRRFSVVEGLASKVEKRVITSLAKVKVDID